MCREAKLVVLDWDPDRHSVRPTSLHYFEQSVPTRGRTAFATGPRAVADPQVCIGHACWPEQEQSA